MASSGRSSSRRSARSSWCGSRACSAGEPQGSSRRKPGYVHVGRLSADDLRAEPADDRRELEAVPGKSGTENDAGRSTPDEKILVGRVVIDAQARRGQWRVRELGHESPPEGAALRHELGGGLALFRERWMIEIALVTGELHHAVGM